MIVAKITFCCLALCDRLQPMFDTRRCCFLLGHGPTTVLPHTLPLCPALVPAVYSVLGRLFLQMCVTSLMVRAGTARDVGSCCWSTCTRGTSATGGCTATEAAAAPSRARQLYFTRTARRKAGYDSNCGCVAQGRSVAPLERRVPGAPPAAPPTGVARD